MKKKIYVFVHIPKSFGVSFLHSVSSNYIDGICKYDNLNSFYDVYSSHLKKIRPHQEFTYYTYKDFQSIECSFIEKKIIPEFLNSKKTKLFLHVHADTFGLDKIIPKEIKRVYIITMRDPEERLISSYHYKIATSFLRNVVRPRYEKNYKTNRFLESLVFECGLDYMIPRIFGLQKDFKIAQHHFNKICHIDKDAYNTKSSIVQYLEKEIGIRIDPVKNNVNIKKWELPPKTDIHFWETIENKIESETRYYNLIKNNNYYNMFLNY